MTRAWLMMVSVTVVLAAVLSSFHTWMSGEGLNGWVTWISLLGGALVSGGVSVRAWRGWFARFWRRADLPSQMIFLVVLTGGLYCLLNLFSVANGTIGTANPNNLGDLPFHLQLVEFFRRGAAFPPMDPTFAGPRLHYAYAMDLWEAVLVRVGLSLTAAFFVTGALCLLTLWMALWRLGGVLLVCAFFFSGGVVLAFDWQQSLGPSSTLAWKNLFFAVFLTQRGMMFALPAGLYLIRKWHRYLTEDDFKISLTFAWIWGVLPFFHLHTFAILSLWMLVTFCFRRRFQWPLVAGASLALFFVLRSVSFGKVESALGWEFFWTLKTPQAWLLNFTAWILLPFWVSWVWIQQKNWRDLTAAWVITAFALSVRLAPWAWDQIKVLLWVYLLWTFWSHRTFRWKGAPALILSLILFWPGLLQWLSGMPSFTGRFDIQPVTDRLILQKLFEGRRPEEIVAASVDHQHPLLGLGQSLVMGYPGHAWSHGQPVESQTAKLSSILSARPDAQASARELGVKWIVWKDNTSLSDSPPLEEWRKLGWSEERSLGSWHLWRVSP